MCKSAPAPRRLTAHARAKAELSLNGHGYAHDGAMSSLQDSLFRHLDDDLVVLIMGRLIDVVHEVEARPVDASVWLPGVVYESVGAALALWSTCRWMHLFSKGSAYELRQEVFCMAASNVVPLRLDRELPFRAQFRAELESYEQYQHLKTACKHFVTHCASEHCARARRGFNEVLKTHGRVRVAFVFCKIMATARCVPVCAIYTQASVGSNASNKHFFVVCSGEPSSIDRLAWRSQSELVILKKISAPDNVGDLKVSPDGTKMLAILKGAREHHPDVLIVDLVSGEQSLLSACYPADEGGYSIVNAWFHDANLPEAVLSVYFEKLPVTTDETSDQVGRVVSTFCRDDAGRLAPWRLLHEDWDARQALWVDTSEPGDCVAVHYHSNLDGNSSAPLVCTTILTVAPSEDVALVESGRHTLAARFVPGRGEMLAMVSSDVGSLEVCCYAKVSSRTWVLQHVVHTGMKPGKHDVQFVWTYERSTCISPCGRFLVILLRPQHAGYDSPRSVLVDLQHHPDEWNCVDLPFPVDVSATHKDYAPRELGWSFGSVWMRTRRGVLHFSNSFA